VKNHLQKTNVLNIKNTIFEELSGYKGRFFELIAAIEADDVRCKLQKTTRSC
jgi:hypothetical protein